MYIFRDIGECGFNFKKTDDLRICVAGDDGLWMFKTPWDRTRAIQLANNAMSRDDRMTALPFVLKEANCVDRIEDCNFLSKVYLLVDGEVVVSPSLTKIWTNGVFVSTAKSRELATNPMFVCLTKAYTAMIFSPILSDFFIWLASTQAGHWVTDEEL